MAQKRPSSSSSGVVVSPSSPGGVGGLTCGGGIVKSVDEIDGGAPRSLPPSESRKRNETIESTNALAVRRTAEIEVAVRAAAGTGTTGGGGWGTGGSNGGGGGDVDRRYWRLHAAAARGRSTADRLSSLLLPLLRKEEAGGSDDDDDDDDDDEIASDAAAAEAEEEAAAPGLGPLRSALESAGPILEGLRSLRDSNGAAKKSSSSSSDAAAATATTPVVVPSFKNRVAGLIDEGEASRWLRTASEEDLERWGGESNRLFQLLVEGKGKESGALELDCPTLSAASSRTDLFSDKQCKLIERRREEVEEATESETAKALEGERRRREEEEARAKAERDAQAREAQLERLRAEWMTPNVSSSSGVVVGVGAGVEEEGRSPPLVPGAIVRFRGLRGSTEELELNGTSGTVERKVDDGGGGYVVLCHRDGTRRTVRPANLGAAGVVVVDDDDAGGGGNGGGTPDGGGAAPPAATAKDWVCTFCTYRHGSDLSTADRCDMCDRPRGAAAAPPPAVLPPSAGGFQRQERKTRKPRTTSAKEAAATAGATLSKPPPVRQAISSAVGREPPQPARVAAAAGTARPKRAVVVNSLPTKGTVKSRPSSSAGADPSSSSSSDPATGGGGGPKQLHHVRCQYGARCRFLRRDDNCRYYHSPSEIAQATADRRVEHVMLISPSMVGVVIGQGGTAIRKIMSESGARVWIDQKDKGPTDMRPVHVSGTRKAVDDAVKMVKDAVDFLRPPSSSSADGDGGGSGSGETPAVASDPVPCRGFSPETVPDAAKAVGCWVDPGGNGTAVASAAGASPLPPPSSRTGTLPVSSGGTMRPVAPSATPPRAVPTPVPAPAQRPPAPQIQAARPSTGAPSPSTPLRGVSRALQTREAAPPPDPFASPGRTTTPAPPTAPEPTTDPRRSLTIPLPRAASEPHPQHIGGDTLLPSSKPVRPQLPTPTRVRRSPAPELPAPPPSSSSSNGTTDGDDRRNLLAFLESQKSCLKGSPESFCAWLSDSEDIVSLSDLADAASDDSYLREVLQPGDGSVGVKGFKCGAFKRAAAKAAGGAGGDRGGRGAGRCAEDADETGGGGIIPPLPSSSPPAELVCPITHVLMTDDPVLAADGHTYERSAIEAWFDRQGAELSHAMKEHDADPTSLWAIKIINRGILSPVTNLAMTNLDLIPNRALRTLARDAAARGLDPK